MKLCVFSPQHFQSAPGLWDGTVGMLADKNFTKYGIRLLLKILSVSIYSSLESQHISQGLAAATVTDRYIWSVSIKINNRKKFHAFEKCISSGYCLVVSL